MSLTYLQTAEGAVTDVATTCPGKPGSPPTKPVLTPAMVETAFKRIPLTGSTIVIQPPDGLTLVNFATNFYTTPADFDRTVRLLGRRVQLHIVAARYTWDFGDGTSAATTEPGHAYPHLDVTHDYRQPGRVSPRVDTTYTATYRVNGGALRPVPGSVTIVGAPAELRVATAHPTLVGYT